MDKNEKWKKKRIAINEENRLQNLQNAYGDKLDIIDIQSKIKHSKLKRKGKLNNNNNIYNNNKNNNKNKNIIKKRELNKENKFNFKKYGHLSKSLEVAQHSTASMGKFDKLNKNEPKPNFKKNNKKIERIFDKRDENSKQKEILFNIFGKQTNDAFNIKKASKSAKIQMEIKRSRKKKRR